MSGDVGLDPVRLSESVASPFEDSIWLMVFSGSKWRCGSETLTQLPRPISLSKLKNPPWSSTIGLTSIKPNPIELYWEWRRLSCLSEGICAEGVTVDLLVSIAENLIQARSFA